MHNKNMGYVKNVESCSVHMKSYVFSLLGKSTLTVI